MSTKNFISAPEERSPVFVVYQNKPFFEKLLFAQKAKSNVYLFVKNKYRLHVSIIMYSDYILVTYCRLPPK